ncbi:hypothetical protein FRC02_003768 [Tulasnella sp. 418]|nr:hypothetical protein FRC02_003768 [Tulasnella sp. 418]
MTTTCSETAPDGLAPILEDVSSVTLEDMDTLASQLVQRAQGLTNENSMETALYEAYNTAALLHTFAIAVSLVDDSAVDGRPTPACGGALNTGADAYEIVSIAIV